MFFPCILNDITIKPQLLGISLVKEGYSCLIVYPPPLLLARSRLKGYKKITVSTVYPYLGIKLLASNSVNFLAPGLPILRIQVALTLSKHP